MISASKLDFWIKNNYNVLFRGKHGVGKSSIIIDAFNRSGLKWKYFSAATMDPWVDFIGVPKEKDGVLELIRPFDFQEDKVEALLFDELNRSHKKVRNSILELIQFKSINGKKFNNLKIIWAAVNPADDEDEKYDVEELDPAQADRFHVQVEIPYMPHLPYFRDRYGEDMAQAAVGWWKNLPDNIKNKVSPRRLDYALDMYKNNGDMRDVLPNGANVSKLITELSFGSISLKLKKLFKNKDVEESRKFLSSENSYSASIEEIIKKKEYIEFFVPMLDDEKISSLMAEDNGVRDFVLKNSSKYSKLISDIVDANKNHKLVRYIRKQLKISKFSQSVTLPSKELWDCVENVTHKKIAIKNKVFYPQNYDTLLSNGKMNSSNTYYRIAALQDIREQISHLLTREQAIKTLELLSIFIGRSQYLTLSRYSNDVIGMINLCLDIIEKSSPHEDIRDVKTKNIAIGKALEYGTKHKKLFYYNFIEKPVGVPQS